MAIGKIRSFTDLNAWREAHRLVLLVYQSVKSFPKEELFCLTIQVKRSALSISSNIAEGFSRRTSKDKIQFYTIAKGSLTELQNQLLVARDVGYLEPEVFKSLADQSLVVGKLLSGLVKSA